ncbi:cytochrome b/b6 domain-containing protein [Sedimentitalea todarodis]|uniref:Cytochrome b/b6 domain-containing protein n=1 Tax=Sedimentitalea todarodis TaxID=1631240 RepID=A0ABU3VCN4_9RHOB|nr:cytochrome b/b6 domain-containing protein [Sedimentitalea todarodis]MDU9003909.1 cytochrome b/b6 domain-containing protein [Sedimentitalea todarodis]
MALQNTPARYGTVSMSFHWLTALLILSVIPLGVIAHDMAHDLRNPEITSTEDDILRTALLFSMHKTTGVLIFFVALARILWAITQTKPAPLHPKRRLESFLAETVHWLLYGSLLLVPLTGWIHHAATVGFAPIWWPFGQNLPFVPKDKAISDLFATLHMVLERVLLVSLILHIAGALKHQIIDRDSTLRRMLPGGGDMAPPATGKAHTALPFVAALATWAAALGIAATLGLFTPHSPRATPAPAPEQSTSTQTTQAEPTGWQVTEGSLAISITQMGSAVSGQFDDWTADITFEDPDTPGPAGRVDVSIAIPSLTLGSVTQQAMGPDFFDAERFPDARFTADITKTETGYVAAGPLTIRDVTILVTLPFDLELAGKTATMTGALTLERLDYGIGANMPDEASLGFAVDVTISLTATRAPATE